MKVNFQIKPYFDLNDFQVSFKMSQILLSIEEYYKMAKWVLYNFDFYSKIEK